MHFGNLCRQVELCVRKSGSVNWLIEWCVISSLRLKVFKVLDIKGWTWSMNALVLNWWIRLWTENTTWDFRPKWFGLLKNQNGECVLHCWWCFYDRFFFGNLTYTSKWYWRSTFCDFGSKIEDLEIKMAVVMIQSEEWLSVYPVFRPVGDNSPTSILGLHIQRVQLFVLNMVPLLLFCTMFGV